MSQSQAPAANSSTASKLVTYFALSGGRDEELESLTPTIERLYRLGVRATSTLGPWYSVGNVWSVLAGGISVFALFQSFHSLRDGHPATFCLLLLLATFLLLRPMVRLATVRGDSVPHSCRTSPHPFASFLISFPDLLACALWITFFFLTKAAFDEVYPGFFAQLVDMTKRDSWTQWPLGFAFFVVYFFAIHDAISRPLYALAAQTARRRTRILILRPFDKGLPRRLALLLPRSLGPTDVLSRCTTRNFTRFHR